jgi:hypothetical protein
MGRAETDWFEVWAEDRGSDPPYLLVVRPDPVRTGVLQVLDPRQADSIIFESEDYEAVRMWLLEDEFGLVDGRTEF